MCRCLTPLNLWPRGCYCPVSFPLSLGMAVQSLVQLRAVEMDGGRAFWQTFYSPCTPLSTDGRLQNTHRLTNHAEGKTPFGPDLGPPPMALLFPGVVWLGSLFPPGIRVPLPSCSSPFFFPFSQRQSFGPSILGPPFFCWEFFVLGFFPLGGLSALVFRISPFKHAVEWPAFSLVVSPLSTAPDSSSTVTELLPRAAHLTTVFF